MAARGGNLRSMMDEGQVQRRGRLAFVREVYSELTKVTWPTRDTAIRLAALVIVVAMAMGVFLGIWDFAFAEIVDRVFLEESR